jgi:RES domain-containing protein
LLSKKYASGNEAVFSGQGAKKYAGRWNTIGTACTYLAGSGSLAISAILGHLNSPALIIHYVLFTLGIAEQYVMALADENLPAN